MCMDVQSNFMPSRQRHVPEHTSASHAASLIKVDVHDDAEHSTLTQQGQMAAHGSDSHEVIMIQI